MRAGIIDADLNLFISAAAGGSRQLFCESRIKPDRKEAVCVSWPDCTDTLCILQPERMPAPAVSYYTKRVSIDL